VKGHCFTIKEGSERIRREGDDANVMFRLEGSLMFQSSHIILFIQNFNKPQRVCRFIVT
jgi:hypothetical protein